LLAGCLAALCLVVRAAPAAACTGDCNADGVVTIDELINGVRIAIGNTGIDRCRACDRDGDGTVSIDELVTAVQANLVGCPATPTPTQTPTAAVTPTATALQCEIDGVICTIAGTGNAQFDGDGRPALDTSLYFPIDVVFDRDGLPLILDWNNLRLRRVNRDGTVTTIMGTDIEDFPVDGELAVDTPLHHASDVEFDDAGRLYVAGDHVPVVFRVGTDDRVFTVAGTRDFGYDGDNGPALAAKLSTPFGVLPDALGGFFISDVDAHVVRYVDPEGIITTVAGTGERGYSGDGLPGRQAQLAGPSRLQIGPDGLLYFCETRNHVIRRVNSDGTVDTVAGTGERGYRDATLPREAQFDTPYDLRFAPDGDLYVADTGNNVIRRIDAAGAVGTVVGTGGAGFGGDGGPAATAVLRRPSAIVFDAAGSLWIADTSNHRVRRVWHFLSSLDRQR
jgi:glucose/arabinose dehydrogenase